MKCLECGKPQVHCRGMCDGCYSRWRRAGKPVLSFSTKTPIEKFEKDCVTGKVAALVEQKMPHLDIARRYSIAESTARKYMAKYNIISIKQKSAKKRDRKGTFYDDAKMLALATPWVKNETPRYYFPF